MLNLLIVDDDILAVKAIGSVVDQEGLGISDIFTAYSMQEAQILLQEKEIQLLLCDIEMPRGNGLDLIEWMKQKQLAVVTLLLTSYADFYYAKKAIALGCTEYLLKPVMEEELNEALRKAIVQYQKNNKLLRNDFSEKATREKFFSDILEGKIPNRMEDIQREGRSRGLDVQEQTEYTLILVGFKHLSDMEQAIDWSPLVNCDQTLLIHISARKWFVIGCERSILLKDGEKFIELCEKMEGADVNCYFSPLLHADKLHAWADKLIERDAQNVMYCNKVFSPGREKRKEAVYHSPDIPELTFMILRGDKEDFCREVQKHIDQILKSGILTPILLKKLEADVIQAVYVALEKREVQAHLLFTDAQSKRYFENAGQMLGDFEQWIDYVADRGIYYCRMAENEENVVEKVLHYIEDHIAHINSRQEIADYVYLNPDYLTRLFKKEKGMPMMKYVNTVRIEKAKHLLSKTNMLINEIVVQIGYPDSSHFSAFFKKATGYSPQDYRKKFSRDENEGDGR